MKISREHLSELNEAKILLESTSLAQKIADIAGKPIEMAMNKLPQEYREGIQNVTEKTLKALLKKVIAIPSKGEDANRMQNKMLVGGVGALGGAFGLPALAIELPISSAIILWSIVNIARSEGENLADYRAQLACLEVFTFSGGSKDNGPDYYETRVSLSLEIKAAQVYLKNATKRLSVEMPPPLIRLIHSIAARFGVSVSQKTAAQLLPLLGAVGGATINTIFIHHFQNMAQGHFIVRKLERIYGESVVKAAYLDLNPQEESAFARSREINDILEVSNV